MSLRLVSRRIVNASSGGLLSSVMRAQSAALVFRASSATRFPVNQRARAPAALAASAVLASQSSPAIADAAVLSSSGALASAPVAGVASSGLATTAAEPLSVAAMAADAVAVSGLDAGFPSWYPTSWLSWVLMKAMSDAVATGGIEWWAAIAGVSFALRPLTVPSAIISQRTSAWFGFHKESLASYQARIAAANKAEDRAAASQAIADYRAFLSKSGLDVFRGMFGPIAGQAFVFISMYSAIRWLVDDAALIPGFSEGGAGLGLALLTVPDPTFCIPALAAVFTAASIVVNPNLVGIPDRGLSAGGHKLSFAALSFLFTSITCFFPAAIQLHLLISAFTSLAQNFTLRQKWVSSRLGFPPSYPPAPASAEHARRSLAAVLSGEKVLPPSMMDDHFEALRPLMLQATNIADGKWKAPKKRAYLGWTGLRDPGAPPPPSTPYPAGIASQQPLSAEASAPRKASAANPPIGVLFKNKPKKQ